jgi:hypothetical protein
MCANQNKHPVQFKDVINPFKSGWSFFGANILGGGLLSFFTSPRLFESFESFLISVIWSTAILVTQWLGHAYLQIRIARSISWIEQPVKRLIVTIFSIVLYANIGFIIVQTLMHMIVFQEIPNYFDSWNFYIWILPIMLSFAISLVTAAIGFFISWKTALEEKAMVTQEMLSYKYEALRNQINPHFMFNSLNVLTDLVYEDQKLAVKFIHQFSDIYRYVLDSRNKELVHIDEELAFLEKFIFLLKMRFGDKLSVEINIKAEEDEFIVPLSLQLLIENAVKHNEISKQNPLKTIIQRQGEFISVQNNIQSKNIGDTSKKIGLQNLKSQFSFFTEIPLEIINDGRHFTVKLPILNKTK